MRALSFLLIGLMAPACSDAYARTGRTSRGGGGAGDGAGSSPTWVLEYSNTFAGEVDEDHIGDTSDVDSQGVTWTVEGTAIDGTGDTFGWNANGWEINHNDSNVSPGVEADLSDLIAVGGGPAYSAATDRIWVLVDMTNISIVATTGGSPANAGMVVYLQAGKTEGVGLYREERDAVENRTTLVLDSVSGTAYPINDAEAVADTTYSLEIQAMNFWGRYEAPGGAPSQPSDVDNVFHGTDGFFSMQVQDGGANYDNTGVLRMQCGMGSSATSCRTYIESVKVYRYREP